MEKASLDPENVQTQADERLLSKIKAIIDSADKFRNCYFWDGSRYGAGGRRSMEREYSHGLVTWRDGKDVFTASYSVQMTCHNVYARGTYTRNGVKTNLTAIKNSYKRLLEQMEKANASK